MISFFEWLYDLNALQAWFLFGLVCLIMAIIPYFHIIKRLLFIYFSNEPTEILDFSWRLAPDHLLVKKGNIRYYIQSNETQFILEGGKIILNWHVKGAYRIDIIGLGKNLKGNKAYVIARKDKCHYKLVAYTSKGKLEKSLNIDPSLIKKLNTFNISRENQFKQQYFEDRVLRYSETELFVHPYSRQDIRKAKDLKLSIPEILVSKLVPNSSLKSKMKVMFGFSEGVVSGRMELDNRLKEQTISKMYGFNPNKYNKAINNHNNILTKQTESYE